MKVNVPVATTPGRASGSTTCSTARGRLAPSTSAASSRSSGMLWKNVRSSHSSRSEEHTSELQSHVNLVCRLLLEKKKTEPPTRSRPEPWALFNDAGHCVQRGSDASDGWPRSDLFFV